MKDIKFYEGLYAITEEGQVWSYKSNRYLKPKVKSNGYLEVTLCRNGEKKSYLIHRLTAEAYIPNPDNLPQVGHLDETRDNNTVSNLYWTTAKDNCNMPKHLRRKSKAQLNNATSREVECIETGVVYPSLSEAGRQFGCSPQNIRRAVVDSTRTASGYHWRYTA